MSHADVTPDPDRRSSATDLILLHRDLPRRLAARYAGKRLDAEELESVGDLALVDAADRFTRSQHPDRCFRSFAIKVIRTAMREALVNAPIVRGARAAERRALRSDAGPAATPRLHEVPIEELALMPEEPSIERRDDLALVEAALARCGDRGRRVLLLVTVEGLSIRQAADRLGMTARQAAVEHDEACRTVAAEFRRRGYGPESWARRIA